MLPQKFSAAATRSFPDDDPPKDDADPPQPAMRAAAPATAPAIDASWALATKPPRSFGERKNGEKPNT
jgi:hypothetical protein